MTAGSVACGLLLVAQVIALVGSAEGSLAAALVLTRALLAGATAHSFAGRGMAYWLAPAADAAAVARVIATMIQRPREWRGRPPEVCGQAALGG